MDGHFIQTHPYFAETDSFSVTFPALGNEFFASKCTNSSAGFQPAKSRQDGGVSPT
jgi:hypothetical protein